MRRILVIIMTSFLITVVIAIALITGTHSDGESYLKKRSELLEKEKLMFFGHNLTSSLTKKELMVDKILLKEKLSELTTSYVNSSNFLPSIHFFQAKRRIEESGVFSIIRRAPKGASLHTHLSAGVSVEFVIKNITYRDDLYVCYINDVFKLKFLSDPKQDNRCNWTEIREKRLNQTSFDGWLKQQFMLNVDNPRETYRNIESVWKKFKKIFSTTYDLLLYKPVFEDYVYELLQELYDDNIMYTELKGAILPLYELSGVVYTKKQFFEIIIDTVNRFKLDHPKFIGARYIYSVYRGVDGKTLQAGLKDIIEMKEIFPDFIVGLDFVGFEEEGKFLNDFAFDLLKVQKDLKFFFHAGETNWFGHTDLNIADAVLLNSFRIGHGLSLPKHPVFFNLAQERNIPLEVCPISNQVLMLHEDPRSHPATYLMALDYPLVVCNDDPSTWNASGLSYDWYVAFMAMTLKMSGIEVLKQLAINSIRYSAVQEELKREMMTEWENQWNEFLEEILKFQSD